jgi:hypothetical protein
MKHLLYSHDKEMVIEWFDKYDKDLIKTKIKEHLKENPGDLIEHCKEFNQRDIKKYYGFNIINFYVMKNDIPYLVKTRNNKDVYYKLS